MTGVDDAGGGNLAVIFAVEPYGFEHEARIAETEAFDVFHERACPLVVQIVTLFIRFEHDGGDVQKYHRHGKRLRVEHAGNAFRGDFIRIGIGIVVHRAHEIVIFARAFKRRFVARSLVIFGVGYYVEGFREHISPLAERFTLFRNGEIHSAVGVYTMFLEEIEAAFREIEPLLASAESIGKLTEHIRATTLHPDAFVGGIDIPFAVQAGIQSAVYSVHAVREPERYTGFEQFAFEQFFIFNGFHKCLRN